MLRTYSDKSGSCGLTMSHPRHMPCGRASASDMAFKLASFIWKHALPRLRSRSRASACGSLDESSIATASTADPNIVSKAEVQPSATSTFWLTIFRLRGSRHSPNLPFIIAFTPSENPSILDCRSFSRLSFADLLASCLSICWISACWFLYCARSSSAFATASVISASALPRRSFAFSMAADNSSQRRSKEEFSSFS